MKRMKEKPDISLWTLICRILPLNYQASPIWFIGNQVGSILHGLIWGVGVLATQLFFDGVTGLVNGTVPNGQAITMLLVMSLVTVVQQILNGVSNFSLNQFSKLCLGHLGQILHGKTARIDPVCFEDPALLDDINKADEGKNNCMGLVFVMTSLFTFYLPYILFMAIYLLTLKPVLTLTIPLVFIPVLLTQIIRGTVFTKLEDQSAPIRREADCYEAAICDRTFFKETRILGAFQYFFSLLTESMQLLKFKKWQAEFRTGLLELGTRLLTLTGYLVILYLLVTNLISGEISIGAFAAVFTSIDMLFGIMEEIVCRHIGHMSKNLGTVRNFIRFLDLPERSGNNADLAAREIVLDAVSFRYPGQSEKAIESVSLKIDAGETVAIVGENGAGKTTLVRLLTGLYLPSSGQVLLNGQETSALATASICQGQTGVFQKFQRYKMTLARNVAISQMTDEINADKLTQALSQAKVNLDESFPDGQETILSREFDGVDLSGGQWQRVAIARGFYRTHDVIVLDEPTASIDPIEETIIYNQFAEISRGKTAIIVTHRLGAARIADRILVMDQGRLLEQGTHAELMLLGGKYADMYKAQAQWYVRAAD